MKAALKFAERFRFRLTRKPRIRSPHPHGIPALILGATVLFLSGCGQRYQIFSDWYSPPKITPLAGLETVAVYLFTDNRQEEDNVVGSSVFHDLRHTHTTVIYGSEPVAVTLTRAFADGLKARGVPVIDVTNAKFDPAKSNPNAPIAVSGDILELRYEKEEAIFGSERGYARCKVILRAYNTSTGTKFWEKEYVRTYYLNPREPERGHRYKTSLGRVLAETVEEAVYDPEFIRAISRKRS